jgi:glycosyltransferase involved in cell wall biosynthesis
MVVAALPLVSIITPVYNGSRYIEDLIQSVLVQDYPNIEHLIIDDGSQDNGATVAVLQKYPHIRWWSHSNRGQYATMNEGFLAARGEVLCFVNADDLVAQDAVKTAVQYMRQHPLLDGVFGSTSYIDQSGKDYPYWVPFHTAPLRFYPYFAHISHCSLYVRKRSLEQHGLFFDPALRFVGDYEWIIRMYKAGCQIGSIKQELSKVRLHTDQASQKNRAASVQEARAVLRSQKINIVSHFLLSTINVFVLRVWKLARLLKSTGVRGMVTYLVKRNSHP